MAGLYVDRVNVTPVTHLPQTMILAKSSWRLEVNVV
jgi:hypothetical protein